MEAIRLGHQFIIIEYNVYGGMCGHQCVASFTILFKAWEIKVRPFFPHFLPCEKCPVDMIGWVGNFAWHFFCGKLACLFDKYKINVGVE